MSGAFPTAARGPIAPRPSAIKAITNAGITRGRCVRSGGSMTIVASLLAGCGNGQLRAYGVRI
jgi:hypothetical protein